MVSDGDVVEIHYTGRVKDTGEIFDLTSSEVAEEEELDTDQLELGPIKVLIGAEHVIPGLEAALRDMDAGDEQTVDVVASDAFGDRSGDDIETFSKREFDEHEVEPRRGLVVEIDGRRGKIVSTASGRVRVDFNHPLAGKDLEYDVEVLAVLDDAEERVRAVLEYYGLEDVDVAVDGDSVSVTLPDDAGNEALRDRLEEEIGMVNGVSSVDIQ